MSKGVGLHSKANSQTKSKTSPLAKVQWLTLFGSPHLVLQGEDPAAYDQLLGRVYAAVKPVDVVDEMFITDVVSLEWEVLRWRRLKSSLMRARALRALEEFLNTHLDYNQYRKFFEDDLRETLQNNFEDQTEVNARTLAHKCAQNERGTVDKVNQLLAGIDLDTDSILERSKARKAKELAYDYVQRKPGTIEFIDKLLGKVGSSINAVMVEALSEELDNIERIERLTTTAETRRNVILREIDRRRAALGEGLRRQVQEVEVEAEVIDEGKVIEKAPAEAKSAA